MPARLPLCAGSELGATNKTQELSARTTEPKYNRGIGQVDWIIDVVEEVSGEDLSWFSDQYIYGDAVVDYRLDRIRNSRVDADSTSTPYESQVWVERVGDGTFPQTLRVTYSDGAVEDVEWDGRGDRWKSFAFTNDTRIVEAELDPDNKVWLDINRLNNRRVVTADGQLAREMQLSAMTIIQHLMYIISGLF